jgi:UrcA family protein
MSPKRKHAGLALLAGAVLLPTGAWSMPPAGDAVVTRAITVKYAPGDAATAEGAAKLYRKLRMAASRACSDPPGGASRFATLGTDYAVCVQAALGKAVQDVGSPLVLALHTGTDKAPTVAAAR